MKIVDKCCCPVCNNEGVKVSGVTVKHLVVNDYCKDVTGKLYKICMNENCDVVYYGVDSDHIFLKDQINVPIWFKKDADPKYACYCSKVTEEEVVQAVIKHGAKTVQEVNVITGAMKNCNCRENNPLGVCCGKTIQKIIDKTQNMK